MAITEQSRHQMIEALTRALGEEAAMTLAAHLPPVGWADVATTRDLDHLEARLEARMSQMESRILGRIVTAVIGSNLTMGALVLAVVSLTS